jgi:hypothetical protein
MKRSLWSLAPVLTLSACLNGQPGALAYEAPKVEPESNPDPALRLSRQQIMADYGDVSCESLRDIFAHLDRTGNTDYFRGLAGTIRSPRQASIADATEWSHLDDYIGGDTVVNRSKLFLTRLDVPTRSFTTGFPKLSGDKIKADDGNDLTEYFHIDFRSELKLGETEEEGLYELATVSDDGVRLSVDGEMHLENPGLQSTRMTCSTSYVDLRRTSSLPIRVEYFQGPRNHIALMMVWRKVDESTERDPLCDVMSISKWFDSKTVPSTPKQHFNDITARGWTVVPAHVFRIPREEYMNPCESEHIQQVIKEETCTASECEGTGI